ncbi:MAG: TerC family protein [Verrucomicrobia bacterium]|nr:TerC family protein [Verrucomicrobiota bacterium]
MLVSTITAAHWTAFLASIFLFLALDLGVFHKKGRVVTFKEALGWTALWFCIAMGFSAWLAYSPSFAASPGKWQEFLAGYLVELSLSMDNVFVIALIFQYFKVPSQYQHRVLFWGILGALGMRAIMIFTGIQLVHEFHWLLMVFGVFLIYSGFKMLTGDSDPPDPEKNPILRMARKVFPMTKDFHEEHFFIRHEQNLMITPLFLVLIMVETTDLIFAVDSIPAIIAISQDLFIVFTSNVFAILGLRSLYFVLANALKYFTYLKYGLAAVLVFIGIKMLVKDWVEIQSFTTLIIIGTLLGTSIITSLLAARNPTPPASPDPESKH